MPAPNPSKQTTLKETITKTRGLPAEIWRNTLEYAFNYDVLVHVPGWSNLRWLFICLKRTFADHELGNQILEEAIDAFLANNTSRYNTVVIELRLGELPARSTKPWASKEVEMLSKIKDLHILVTDRPYVPYETTASKQADTWQFGDRDIVSQLLPSCRAFDTVVVCLDLNYVAEESVEAGTFPVHEVLETVLSNTTAKQQLFTMSVKDTFGLEGRERS